MLHPGPIQASATLGATSQLLTGGDDGLCCLTCLSTGFTATLPQSHKKGITSLSTFENASCASRGYFSSSRDLTIRLWSADRESSGGDSAFKELLNIESEHSLTPTAISNTKDGTRLVSGGRDYVLKVYDVFSGGKEVSSKVISSNKTSRNLVTCLDWWKASGGEGNSVNLFSQGSEDLTCRVWDAREDGLYPSITFGKYVYFPLSVSNSSCGNQVTTSSKGFNGNGCEGRVWDVRSPAKPLLMLEGHRQDATSCAYVNLGEKVVVVTVSKDEAMIVWDGVSGEILAKHEEEDCGMWTSISAVGEGVEIDKERVAVVGTTFGGEVFAFGMNWTGLAVDVVLLRRWGECLER